MSKAIKFKDYTYLDSTGVVHERTPLNELLNNIGNITNAYSTSQTDAYSCNYINEKLAEYEIPSYSKIYLTNNQSLTANTTNVINLNTIDVIGEGMEFNSNGIKITSSKRKIAVVDCLYTFSAGLTGVYFFIFVNGDTKRRIIVTPKVAEYNYTCVIPVNKDDIITMGVYPFAAGTALGNRPAKYNCQMNVSLI